MFGELMMGRYHEGDHVKLEVKDEQSGEIEWVWLLVDHSDDERQLVFGQLDSEPVVATGVRRGQSLAVSYQQVRDHKKSTESYLHDSTDALQRHKKSIKSFFEPGVRLLRRSVSRKTSLIAVCSET
jgi:uncharacterized protein YegJ (DUF2314 family)